MTASITETARIHLAERVDDLLAELDVLLLENARPDLRLSIYQPVGHLSEDADKARIAMYDRVVELRLRFAELGTEVRKINEFIASMEKFTETDRDNDFWRNQPGGIAVFADANGTRLLEVAADFEPAYYISNHWHLSPLLALAANADCYWLLSLRQDAVQFFRGSRLGIREVPLLDTFQWPAMAGSEEGKTRIAEREALDRLLQSIDRSVAPSLDDGTAPLILAGDERMLPLFREVTTYPHLFDKPLGADASNVQPEELHRLATHALAGEFIQSRKRELLKINSMFGTDRVETDLETILEAAYEGRVAALVAPSDKIRWGLYEPLKPGSLQELTVSDPRGRDLYEQAAEETLDHQGRLFYLESVKMPHGHSLCAELRY